MADYKLMQSEMHVFRTADSAVIPNDPGNVDWIEYQAWLDAGGVPDPYVPALSPDAATVVNQSYRAGLVRQADKLQAKGQNYDAIKLLFKATS